MTTAQIVAQTTAQRTAAETDGDTVSRRPLGARLRIAAILALIASLSTMLLVDDADPAHAATFHQSTITCRIGEVVVDAGVDAVHGSDGYWRAFLFRWTGDGWQATGDSREGRESRIYATIGGTSFSGLQRGHYAVAVQRWNMTSGGWQYLGHQISLESVAAATGGSRYWCTV